MNLYIPEIKDQLKLTQPWEFDLVAEGRNDTLGKHFGCYRYYNYNHFKYGGERWIREVDVPLLRDPDYEIDYPSRDEHPKKFLESYGDYDARLNNMRRELELACPEFIKYEGDRKIWEQQCIEASHETIRIIFPVDTILQVDRIYIRKGMSDYSSVTFYCKTLPPVPIKNHWYSSKGTKNKAIRFWASLSECNKIQFEKV